MGRALWGSSLVLIWLALRLVSRRGWTVELHYSVRHGQA
jgi:hypothetical protein